MMLGTREIQTIQYLGIVVDETETIRVLVKQGYIHTGVFHFAQTP